MQTTRLLLLLAFGVQFAGIADCFAIQESKPASQKVEFFENRIRPVLIKNCFKCHSPDSDEIGGNLLLDSRKNILKGGDLGPALIPGKPEQSLLLSALNHDDLEMPPDGKLPKNVISDFEKWILDGAVDPRTGGAKIVGRTIDLEEGRKFWSFQPLVNPLKSGVDSTSGQSIQDGKLTPIDFLVQRKLAQKGISFAQPAAPLELLERVYFDLIGLPPPPRIQKKFESGQLTLESIVDDLLESKHYGERMGRHWLDVARYADSSGGGRILLFPDAWRYRDYVIQSFNDDKPFDRFVLEQVAGDLLDSKDKDRRAEQLTATGFLMLGAHNYELQDKELLRMEVVDEQINVVGRAFLGMTLSCARCHDHKFDPIPTSDYYALAGIFRSTKSLLPGNVSQFVTTNLPLSPEEKEKLSQFNLARTEAQKKVESIQSAINRLENNSRSFDPKNLKSFAGLIVDEEQAEITGNWTQSTSIKPFVGKGYHHSPENAARMFFRFRVIEPGSYSLRAAYTASSNRTSKAKYRVKARGIDRTFTIDQRKKPPLDSHFAELKRLDLEKGDQVSVMLMPGPDGTTIADAIHLMPIEKQKKTSTDEEKKRAVEINSLRAKLNSAKTDLAKYKTAPVKVNRVMSVQEESKPEDFHICIRGDVHSLGPKIPRRGLAVIGRLGLFHNFKGSGRMELAKWIANSDHPLTARVYANRIWYWVFGQGLVSTPDNFGSTGTRPINAELLDYLACRLIESGWSTKKLVREIVLSKTYRQSVSGSQTDDPENKYFGRHPGKRLDAESIRDRMLSFSGALDESSGGPSIKPGTKREFGYKYDSLKRSVYLPVFRNTLNEVFEVFDFPNPNLVSGKRNSSILPTQALFLMNSRFVTRQSANAASRILASESETFEQQLEYAYRLAVARPPSSREIEIAHRFFGLHNKSAAQRVTDEKLWSRFCQLLISSIDFRYLN